MLRIKNRMIAPRRVFLKKSIFLACAMVFAPFFKTVRAKRLNEINSDTIPIFIKTAVNQIKAKKIKSESLVKYFIKQARKYESLNALLFFQETKNAAFHKAREIDRKIEAGQPVGKLAGISFVVKDNIDVAGVSTTAGSKALEGNRPVKNSPIVQKLIDEDAIFLSKANMHEMAFGITGLNASYGDAKNFFDSKKIAGGSSSGSSVALAADMSFFALGTDTGGSTRIPPSLNGLVGFRPTKGRYNSERVVPISHTRDTIGLITKNVTDAITLDQIIKDDPTPVEAMKLESLRLGVPRDYYHQNLSKEVNRLTEITLKKLKKAGATLVEEDIPDLVTLNNNISFVIALYEANNGLREYFKSHNITFDRDEFLSKIRSVDVKGTYKNAVFSDFIKEEQYKNAIQKGRPALIKAIEDYYSRHKPDAIIFPMTPVEACSIKDIKNNRVRYDLALGGVRELTALPGNDQIFSTYIQNADPGSNAGMPGVTVPMGKTAAGLPVGIGIDANRGEDRKLLGIAKAIENLNINDRK